MTDQTEHVYCYDPDNRPNPIDTMNWDAFSDLVSRLRAGEEGHPYNYQEWLDLEGITDEQVQARIDLGE